MPNFVPKAFQRRKSAGNAMEDLLDKLAGTPSFRVMPRNEVQDSGSASFTVRRTVAARPVSSFEPRPIVSPVHHTRQPSYDDGIRNMGNRGSNGSSAGNSSRFYDTGSSQRYSSSSTLPSSTDIEEENLFTKKVPTPGDGGRTSSCTSFTRLSFGGKKKSHKDLKLDQPPAKLFEPDPMPDPMSGRNRALTASSSASTAHPPKLEDLPKADFGNELSNLFGSFGNDRRSAPLEDSAFALPPPPLSVRSGSDSALPPKALVPAAPPAPASPVRVVQRPEMMGSPYSWHSQDSNEALMSSPPTATPPRVETLPPAPTTEPPPPPQPRASSTSPVYERKFGSNGLTKRPKTFEDEDARMVRDSFRKSRESRELERASAAQTAKRHQDDEPHSSDVSTKSASFSSGESSIHQHQSSPPSPEFMDDSTPRARLQNEEEQPLFDNRSSWNKSTTPPTARPGVRFEENKPKPRMTQAEFARLKRQHLRKPQDEESESEADEYIDDDQEEEERKKMEEMRRIRQEQQEKMNAHREMMKKTTGGMNRPLSGERRGLNRSSLGSSELLGYHASAAFENAEDDSDDIPLGILKEHNFPKLGNRLSHAGSQSNMRSASAQGFRPGSAMDGDHRGSLPPFARNLPADVPQEPYYGANLVQQPARESLGFGAIGPGPIGPGSTYGGSNSGVGNAQPTLVNMIADAEQAKEARRGGSSKIYGSSTFGNSTFGQRIPQTTQQPQVQMPPQSMGMMPMLQQQQQQQQQQPMGFMPQQQMQQPQMLMPPMGMGIQQMQIQMQQMQQMANLQQQMQNMLLQQQQQASMIPQSIMPSPMMQPGMMPQMPPQMPQSNFLTPNQGQRTMSMGNGPRPTSVFNQSGRTSTMNMSSTMGPRFGSHLATGYAPSLAPSERSNIGKSARYRPVSQHIHDGSSTVMSQTTVQPATAHQASFQQPSPERLTIRVKPKPARTPTEDDDEGWTSPKAKKWAAKSKDKENQQLPELTFSADE